MVLETILAGCGMNKAHLKEILADFFRHPEVDAVGFLEGGSIFIISVLDHTDSVMEVSLKAEDLVLSFLPEAHFRVFAHQGRDPRSVIPSNYEVLYERSRGEA